MCVCTHVAAVCRTLENALLALSYVKLECKTRPSRHSRSSHQPDCKACAIKAQWPMPGIYLARARAAKRDRMRTRKHTMNSDN